MSDRIAFIVGNTSGRDHLTWPTILRSEIATVVGSMTDAEKNALWPVDITLAQVMALDQRVKKWRLNGSISATKTIDGTDTATGTAELEEREIVVVTESDSGEVEATRESDLVKTQLSETYKVLTSNGIRALEGNAPISNWAVTANFGATFWSGSTPLSGTGALLLEIFRANGFVLYDPDTQLFSPSFNGIGELIAAAISGNPLQVFADTCRTPVTLASGITPLTLLAPAVLIVHPVITASFDVPLQLSWRFLGQTPGLSVSGSASAEFTLTAIEFWPCANSQNLPVYDSATGEQLRSPFS